jgi:hypothetical protein
MKEEGFMPYVSNRPRWSAARAAGAVVLAGAACAALFVPPALARSARPLAVAAISAPPAQLKNVATHLCLKSNYAGKVWVTGCVTNDNYQKWFYREGDIVDNQTGLCLDANHHQGIFTKTCDNASGNDEYQGWSAAGPESEAWWSYFNIGVQECLDDNIHQGLFMNGCTNTLVNNPYQEWAGVNPFTS